MANFPGQDQAALRGNSAGFFGGIKGMFEDWGEGIGNFFEDAENNAKVANQKRLERKGYATPRRVPEVAKSGAKAPKPVNPLELQMRSQSQMPSPMANTTSGESEIAAMLKQMLGGGASMYEPGPDNPYLANLDTARSSALKAIADVRDRTNQNFEQSNSAISGIYEKGRRDTLSDNAVLQANTDSLKGGLDAMYDSGTADLQQDRDQALQMRTEMLNRLGIGAAGLGDAGQVQDQAIADNEKLSSAAQDKALQYGAADIASNTARASGLISEGAGRQSELRSQLSDILGQLSMKEMDVEGQYADKAMNARNQVYQDNLSRMQALYGMYDKEQSRAAAQDKSFLNSSVIAAMVRNQGGGANGNNSMNNLNNAATYIQSQGANPSDYENAYTDAIMGVRTVPGQSPTDQQIMQEMLKRGTLDPNLITNFVAVKQNPNKYQASSGAQNLPYQSFDMSQIWHLLGQ